jgi:hypothetical protein
MGGKAKPFTSDLVGDAALFQYIVHSPDKNRFPLPSNLHEGQLLPIGGNGISDAAFYAHAEAFTGYCMEMLPQLTTGEEFSLLTMPGIGGKKEIYYSL